MIVFQYGLYSITGETIFNSEHLAGTRAWIELVQTIHCSYPEITRAIFKQVNDEVMAKTSWPTVKPGKTIADRIKKIESTLGANPQIPVLIFIDSADQIIAQAPFIIRLEYISRELSAFPVETIKPSSLVPTQNLP